MRRKSIGATSQAFHERDAGLRGLLARSPGAWGPAQRLKCWSEDGNPFHGTVKLRLRKPSNAPQGQRIGGLWARSSGGLGPGPPGLGARPTIHLGPLPHKNHPNLSNAKAWLSAETAASEVGTWRETKPGYPP